MYWDLSITFTSIILEDSRILTRVVCCNDVFHQLYINLNIARILKHAAPKCNFYLFTFTIKVALAKIFFQGNLVCES